MRMSAEYAFGIVRPPDESMAPDSPIYRSLGILRFYSARTCSRPRCRGSREVSARRWSSTREFDVVVDGQRLDTLSGSGKAVANLALRLGLGQVLTNNVLSVFVGDEIDASMDEDRAKNLGERRRSRWQDFADHPYHPQIRDGCRLEHQPWMT
jgi:hypothetical protein